MLDKSICHYRGVRSVLLLLFIFFHMIILYDLLADKPGMKQRLGPKLKVSGRHNLSVSWGYHNRLSTYYVQP